MNTVDPDSVTIRSRQGTHAGYNAQVVADSKHGLVVTTEAVSHNTDTNQLSRQLEQAKSVLFEYYKGRSPNEPLRDLSTFKGYIQTDGYSGYTHLAETAGITHLSCWCHARRYFDKALPNDQLRAAKVLKLIQLSW